MTTQTPDAVREAIIAAITKADANFGYSYRLTKMDDTGEEHTLFMDGFEPAVFADREDGYPVIEQRRNAARTDAILAAFYERMFALDRIQIALIVSRFKAVPGDRCNLATRAAWNAALETADMILAAALDSRAGDAGEGLRNALKPLAFEGVTIPRGLDRDLNWFTDAVTGRSITVGEVLDARAALSATPAPAVDAGDGSKQQAFIFDVLEALKPHFPRIAFCFARGTGGIEREDVLAILNGTKAPDVDAVPAGEVGLLKEAARAHRQCATIANLYANAADNQGRYLLKPDALEAVREVAHRIGCAAGQIDLQIAALSHGEGRE